MEISCATPRSSAAVPCVGVCGAHALSAACSSRATSVRPYRPASGSAEAPMLLKQVANIIRENDLLAFVDGQISLVGVARKGMYFARADHPGIAGDPSEIIIVPCASRRYNGESEG